ncbi:TetR/AcrR family transcriptional regulator [Paenibacillus sp. Z3-2]
MKANEIKQSALVQFVNKGYEATSLDDIVADIGIKKQSVYSHFKHKEDIFLQVIKDTVNVEIVFINRFFEEHKQYDLKVALFQLLTKYKERYLLQEEQNIKFLLRMAFMPPFHLQDIVMNHFYLYNQELGSKLKEVFLKAKTDGINVTAEDGAISFLNFLDGILVELIYSDSNITKFESRLNISWEIYWRGISR